MGRVHDDYSVNGWELCAIRRQGLRTVDATCATSRHGKVSSQSVFRRPFLGFRSAVL